MARAVYKYRIRLSGGEKQALRQAKKKGHQNARLVSRIMIILLAHKGKTLAETAELLDCSEQTVLSYLSVKSGWFLYNDVKLKFPLYVGFTHSSYAFCKKP